jgi:hypothetical protein
VTIHVAFTAPSALHERCATSSVYLARNEAGYDPETLLPAPGWEPLTAEQINALSVGPAVDGALVEIVRPHRDVPKYDATADEISSYDPFRDQWASWFLGFVDNLAGQATTTVDTDTGLRLGVHLDNFDKLPTVRRTSSRRRLAVNLGPGSRYIVLATDDIQQISDAMGASTRHPHTNDVRRYVREGSGLLRCIRIRLDPGEGYIAPTELIPHDGSTWGVAAPSRIAFWLGHWPAGTLPTLI